MSAIREYFGDDFTRYEQDAQRSYFVTERIGSLSTPELLAVVGWLMESNRFWRDELTKKLDR